MPFVASPSHAVIFVNTLVKNAVAKSCDAGVDEAVVEAMAFIFKLSS